MTDHDCPVILIDHGADGSTVGDDAMVLSVLHDLRRLFFGNVSFRVTSPSDKFGRWLDTFPDVERVPSPNLCCRIRHRLLSAALGRVWRRGLRPRVERIIRSQMARRLKQQLVARPIRASDAPASQLAAALASSDAVHIVGGGYLNSYWPHTMVWPKWALVRAAAALGKPVFISGQGIGPLRRRRDRSAIRDIVTAATITTLRERLRSPQILADIGCPVTTYSFAGDDALGLPRASPAEMEGFWARANVPCPDAYLCANIRFARYAEGYTRYKERLARFLDRVVEIAKLPLVFLPMSAGKTDDAASAHEVIRQMRHRDRCTVIPTLPTPQQAKAVVASARACVALSYHFALFALSQSIPTVLIHRGGYYTGKMEGLADCFGVPEMAVNMADLGEARTASLVERMIGHPEHWARKLEKAAAAMMATVSETRRREVDIIRKLIENRR